MEQTTEVNATLATVETFVCVLCKATKPIATEGGTGYCETTGQGNYISPNGRALHVPQGRVCYACMDAVDRACMHTYGKATLYLIEESQPANQVKTDLAKVQNWCGTLSIPCRITKRSVNNWGAKRTTVHFQFNGYTWTGENIGDNQVLRCHVLANQGSNGFEILNHGVDHAQYFPGCGTYGSRFEFVATGTGMDAVEAYEDALDQIAMAHDSVNGKGIIEALNLTEHPKGYGINKRNKVPAECSKHDDNENYYYVSIRYNLPVGYGIC